MARDDDGRRPTAGRDAEHRELDWQERRRALGLGDVGVDAADERLDNRLSAWMVMCELGVEIAPEHVQPRPAVPLQFAPAQDLGDGAGRLPPPHLELEQPVLRGRVALREEQVLLGRRVDVVDAPAVAPDLDRLRQPGHQERRSLGAQPGRSRHGEDGDKRKRCQPERGRSHGAPSSEPRCSGGSCTAGRLSFFGPPRPPRSSAAAVCRECGGRRA